MNQTIFFMKNSHILSTKIVRLLFIGLLILNFNRAGAQQTFPLKQHAGTQSWSTTLEYIYLQIEARLNAAANMDLNELKLCKSYYTQEIVEEKRNILRAVRNDSINNFNAEEFINQEVTKYLVLYNKFKQLNIQAPPNQANNILVAPKKSTPGVMSVSDPDTIMPDPGVCQGPCTNLGFESGTMDGWRECGAETFYCDSNVAYPGSPRVPWGFMAYHMGCCSNRLKADCYGPTGGLTQAANCAPMLSVGENPDYQVRIMNAGTKDWIDTSVSQVYPGMAHSVLLGDSAEVSLGAAILEQKFLVTKSNAAFTYMYAAFLQNPRHDYYSQPTFNINFFDQNGDTIPGCGNYLVIAGANSGFYPYFDNRGDTLCFVKPWTCVFVPLKKYIGQCVTVQFITRDCALGAHFAYAYIDAKCDTLGIKLTPAGDCKTKKAVLTAPVSCGIASYLAYPALPMVQVLQ